jgi:hypothetical protein
MFPVHALPHGVWIMALVQLREVLQKPLQLGTLTTGGSTWSNNAVVVNFPAALNNSLKEFGSGSLQPVQITGGGNRASTAIDDVTFSWN